MDPAVSIAIINWNTKDLLENCLRSIYDSPSTCESEVLVVDNASTDGSAELLRRDFPQVKLIANKSNRGYATAANQAVQSGRGRYIFVLNSDTEIFPGAVDALLAFADDHSDVGAIGPRLINPDGTLQLSCRRFPSFGTGVGHALLSLFSANNPYTKKYRLTDWDHAEATEVDWVSGAALFLRRDAVLQVGLFDETYFMYVEDMDLCYRLWEAHWTVYYQPAATVMHYVAQSSRIRSPQMVMEHHKSLYRFISKNNAGYMRLMNLPIGAGLIIRGSLAAAVSVVKNGLGRRFGGSKAEGQ